MASNYGLLSVNRGLLWDIVAYNLGYLALNDDPSANPPGTRASHVEDSKTGGA